MTAPTVVELERVVCGCGRHLPLYARRSRCSATVLDWPASITFASTEGREAIRLADHHGAVIHRCPRRDWTADAHLHLISEPAKEPVDA